MNLYIRKELRESLDKYISDNYINTEPADKITFIEKISGFISKCRLKKRKRNDKKSGSCKSRQSSQYVKKNTLYRKRDEKNELEYSMLDDYDECYEDDVVEDSEISETLKDRIAHMDDTWQESLLYLIDEKGYTDTEVYKRAGVDRKLFSKIRGNSEYQPRKTTAIALALALRLNIDETKDLIGRAGYTLSKSRVFDLIIEYFIEHGEYNVGSINEVLYEYDQVLLC